MDNETKLQHWYEIHRNGVPYGAFSDYPAKDFAEVIADPDTKTAAIIVCHQVAVFSNLS